MPVLSTGLSAWRQNACRPEKFFSCWYCAGGGSLAPSIDDFYEVRPD